MDQICAQMVIKLGYRGAGFCGFAPQPEVRTVAGELIMALQTILHRPIEITCAGRTDAGVHAQAQYVSFGVYPCELELPKRRLLSSLNALCSDDIAIQDIYLAPVDFSARFSAVMRSYRYRIFSSYTRPILGWEWSWWVKSQLDVERMNEAAQYLVGEHDFKSFCKAISAVDRPTCRYVDSLTVSRQSEAAEDFICIDITGNAFLHSMVRTITGTLVEVGRGHKDPEWVKQVLKACDRTAAGPCAPAKGLTFACVEYPEGVLDVWPN